MNLSIVNDKIELAPTAGTCPKCKSDNIHYEGPEFDDAFLWYKGYCEDCETEFDELYELTYIKSEIKEKE